MSGRLNRYILLFIAWGLVETVFRIAGAAGFIFSFRQLTLPFLFGEFVERGGGALLLPPAFLDGLYLPGVADRLRLLLAAAVFYGMCGLFTAVFPGGVIAAAGRKFQAFSSRFSPYTGPLFAVMTCAFVAAVVRGHENVSMAPAKVAAYAGAAALALAVSLVCGALLERSHTVSRPLSRHTGAPGDSPAGAPGDSPAGASGDSTAGASIGSPAGISRAAPPPRNLRSDPAPLRDFKTDRPSLLHRFAVGPGVLLVLAGLAFFVRAAAPPVQLPPVDGLDPADPPPSIILLVIDTLRSDHLGCYGYPRAVSPFIDSLAASGVKFERAYSQAPWTCPSLMSLFTGTYAAMHRLDTTYRQGTRKAPLLAELLQDRGYRTIGLVSNLLAGAKFGFSRGFDIFDDTSVIYAPAGEVTDRAVALLDQAPEDDSPLFFYILYFDPHMPYQPPAPFDKRFMGGYQGPVTGSYDDMERLKKDVHADPDAIARMEALYDGEIACVDHNLRRLFDKFEEMDLLDRGWVFITSDHGEEFGEHGGLGHARTLYEEQLRVPLIALPGGGVSGSGLFREAVSVDRPVSLVDLSATILDIAGASRGDYLAGVSLLESGSGQPESAVFSETSRGAEELRAVIKDGYKYIHDSRRGSENLYALEADPAESNDISNQDSGKVSNLRENLLDLVESSRRTSVDFETRKGNLVPDRLTGREREALRAMGYIN